MSFIQLTTPLVLHADPVLPGHAVTKRYVDSKKTSLQASWFTTGVISTLRLPALSGDISSAQGSGTLSLLVNGVTPGTYAKVTVDSTGRVTAGGSLTASDIPNVDWSKVTTGKPTTASGYGITNVIPLSGGTSSGHITTTAVATDDMHAVTKAYVDDNITGVVSASLLPGDVVRKVTDVTPSGFFRCNGALLNKTDYPALYGALASYGNIETTLDYTSYSTVGAGQPWRQQYDINATQSGDITSWTTSTSLPDIVSHSRAIVTKNRVYLLGGASSSTVYTAPINPDGTLGTWTTSTSLPANVAYSQAIVTKNRVYLLGGPSSSTVYTAPINLDGTLGTWTTSTSLPAAVTYSQAIVTKNRVYLLGGHTGSALSSTVYTAPINSDGTLGAWTTSTSLPATVSATQAIVTKNRVYLLGGITSNSYSSSTVYTAPINLDGTLGTWTTSTSLPATVDSSQVIVTKNRVYLLGGFINSSHSSTVYTAPISLDGTLGSWTTSASLPTTVIYSQAIVTKNRVYLLGGFINGSYSSTVYTAPISGGLNDYSKLYDGSINKFDGSNITGTLTLQGETAENYLTPGSGRPWEQQYLLATTQSGNITGTVNATGFPVAISGAQALVTKNKAYILGGKSGLNHLDTIYQATVNADGTLGNWVDNATYVNTTISGSGSMTILAGAKVVAVTAKGGDGVNTSTPYSVTFSSTSGSGTVPTGVSSISVTAKGGDGTTTTNSYSANLTGTGSGTIPSSISSFNVTIVGKGADGSTSNSAGEPWRLQYDINTTQSGSIEGWTYGGFPFSYLQSANPIVIGDKLHLIGGLDETNPYGTRHIRTATIDANGNLTNWITYTNALPFDGGKLHIVKSSSRVYIISGQQDNGYARGGLYSAPINPDNTLGGWRSEGLLFGGYGGPNGLVFGRAFCYDKYIYLAGGAAPDGGGGYNISSEILRMEILADGTLSTALSNSNLAPATSIAQIDTAGLAFHAGELIGNKIYLLGGTTRWEITNKVRYWAIGADGSLSGAVDGPSLPVSERSAGSKIVGNKLFYLTESGKVYSAVINANGTLANWVTEPSLLGTGSYLSDTALAGNKLYVFVTQNNNTFTVSWTQLINTNTITNWYETSTRPGLSNQQGPGQGSAVFATKNKVYSVGGYVVDNADNTVAYSVVGCPINPDGSLGAWIKESTLPIQLRDSVCLMTSNKVYLLGGRSGTGVATSCLMATIDSSGNLSNFNYTGSLAKAVHLACGVVTGNRLYILGGYDNTTLTDTIQYCNVDTNGNLGGFTIDTNILPQKLQGARLITTNKRIYLIGGTGDNSQPITTTYTAPINADGTIGSWTTGPALPNTLAHSTAYVTKNKVYLFGGSSAYYQGTTSVVYTAPINADGTIGNWSTGSSLPEPLQFASVVSTKDKIHLIGGMKYSTDENNLPRHNYYYYTASISGGLNDYSSYYANAGRTVGANTTVSVNGSTYTFEGGNGTQATQSTKQVTLPGTYSVNYNWNVASTGSASISYTAGVLTTGASTTFTINGTTLTFPGGVGVAATESTQTLIGLSTTTTNSYSYSRTGTNASGSMSYTQVTKTTGPSTTFSLNGTTLTFPGGAETAATTSTQYITLSGGSAMSASYNVASGVTGTVKYIDYNTSLSNGTVLPAKLSNSNIVVTKNRIYMIGGNQDNSVASTVYTATINTDGSLSGWNQSSTLPGNVNREFSSMVVTRDMIHVIGGKAVGTGTPSSAIYSASIDGNGLIGTWVTSTSLPTSFYAGAIFNTYNRVYLLSGYSAGSTSTLVYTATINPDGTFGTWSTSIPLPTHAAYGKVYVSKNTVYVFGANNTTTMYYADISADGTIGSWSTGTATGYAPVNAAIFSTNGKLYLVGGGANAASSTNVATYSIGNTLSDYSAYYNGSILPLSPTSFRLPDFSAVESNGINFYIKY